MYYALYMNNFHVLVVHFPVALLSIYAVMEFVRWKVFNEKPYWFYLKAVFVVIGTLGAYAASMFGDLIEDAIAAQKIGTIPNIRDIIDMHATFAGITTVVFSLLAGAYVIAWIEREQPDVVGRFLSRFPLLRFVMTLKDFLLTTPVAIVLAFVGLIAITITGAIGGGIVSGPDVDPIVTLVYRLLF